MIALGWVKKEDQEFHLWSTDVMGQVTLTHHNQDACLCVYVGQQVV